MPPASCSTTSRVPLAASITGRGADHPGLGARAARAEHPRRRAHLEPADGGLRHPDRGQHRRERRHAEQRIARVDQPLHPRHPRRHHAVERRDDAGEVVVALGLPQREVGLAVLELDLLGVRPSDHAGGRQGALPLHPLRGVGRLLPGLGQGDLLVGALEPGEQLAGRDPRADVGQDALDQAGDRATTAASCST